MRTISNIKLDNVKRCTNKSVPRPHVRIYCKTSINLVIGITYLDVQIEFRTLHSKIVDLQKHHYVIKYPHPMLYRTSVRLG